MANFSSQCTSSCGSISILSYTILLDTKCVLAHIGALPSLYKSHITLSCYQVFDAVSGEKFRVDIDNSAIRYYYGVLFYFLFYFVYINACNLVFAFVRVIIVKVIVNVYEDGVKLNYFRLILNQKEPYTDYVENKEKHIKEI